MKRKLALVLTGAVLVSSLFTMNVLAEEKSPEDFSGTLNVWGWTTDPEYQIEKFEAAYPNVDVEYTQIGTDYDTKMKTIIENETEGPDVFYSDVKNVKYYLGVEAWKNLSEEPFNVDTSDTVEYVAEIASDEAGVRALSYQAAPGGFWYKRDMAKQYLGTDDPAELAEMFSTMDGILEAAEKIKVGSEGKTSMFATYKDLWIIANYGMRTTPWVIDGVFNMDEAVPEFFDLAKTIEDNGYAAKIDTWTDAWYASAADESVFGYVLPTWGLQYVIQTGAPDSAGNWGITSLSTPYFNGGSYLGIYSMSENTELAWEYIKFVCQNEEFLTQFATEKGDFTSSISVNKTVGEGYENEWCNGQNTIEFFNGELEKINTSLVTEYDDVIGNLLLTNVDLYVHGELDKDAAIAQFKEDVKSNYRALTVE